MKRRLLITLLTFVTTSLALGHTENEQAGHHSIAARQRHEGSPQRWLRHLPAGHLGARGAAGHAALAA